MKSLITENGIIKFGVAKVIWMYLIFAVSFTINFNNLEFNDFLMNCILLLLTVGIGHSVGLHRGVIHKSYKSSKYFRDISLYLFVLTGMGSPLNWLKQHYYRDYWQNRKDCPRYFRYQHSLLKDYWWNLHLSFAPKSIETYTIPSKDLNDKWLLHLDKYWRIHYLLFALIIYFIFGLNTMLFLMFFRSSIVILGHWFIGYSSHKWGYARHKIKDADESGYNNFILGLISFGEGFHNNHHSYPTSAKFSSRWYEIDIGWFLVFICKKIGWIYNVKTQENNLKSNAIKI